MRVKEVIIYAQDLLMSMEDGQITMDDAVDALMREFSINSTLAYEIMSSDAITMDEEFA